MLDAVTKGFRAAKHKLTGKAELTEANIDDALRDIRVALLEADVEFNVAKRFLARVKEKAVGEVVATAVTDRKGKKLQVAPGDHFIKICHDELEALMGPVDTSLVLTQKGERPSGIMMVGLQGSGKTTTVAKLEQLKARVEPENILLVADAMIGQDAVKTAAEFDRRLGLSGFVLTKLDGDARGGAALSIKEVTGKPIKFVGMGEAMDKLEEFRPEGIASRILGFGDIVGLMKDFEGVVDEKKAEEDAEKILTGNFDLHDFVEQIKLVKKMGSVNDLLEKFPLFGELPEGVTFDDKELHRVEAIISSMTATERKNPSVIGDERIERIARGSGQKKEHVRGLLERFFGMQKVMRQLGGGPGAPGMNLLQRLPGFRQLAQLNQLKGMAPEDLAKLFGVPQDLGAGALPAAGGKGSHSAAMARARLMGMGAQPARVISDEEKRRLREKKKKERQNKKKNRRR